MDSQRAKEILLLYRPDIADAGDPEIKEALERVKNDPQLSRWFEEHCARQSQIRTRLRQIPVPEDLRRRILAGVSQRKVVIWWQKPAVQVWAAAAAIILLAGVIYFWPRPGAADGFAAYRNRMVRQAQRMYRMDMETNDVAAIRQYLSRNQGHADFVLPPPMQKLPGVGSAILPWRSNKVSLVCLNSGTQGDLYLFIINRSDLPDPPPENQPQFSTIGRLMSASWTHADKTYILAGRGDETFVKGFLGNTIR